jgi:excisionase family DNA binding protein
MKTHDSETPKNLRHQPATQPFQLSLPARDQAKRMRRGRAKRRREDDRQPNRLAWPIPEGARRMGISRTTVYKLASEGKLRLLKIAGRTLIPEAEIVRLVEKC